MQKTKRIINKKLTDSYRKMPCLLCQVEYKVCGHHIWRKKVSGPDLAWNLVPLCESHHNEIHWYGEITSTVHYGVYEQEKLRLGWYYESFGGWSHPERDKMRSIED
jgi:hypothetical protein